MKSIIIIIIFIILALGYVVMNRDKMLNIQELNYSNEQEPRISSPKNNCQAEGRLTPSGHLPGSWIILTDSERKELIKTFVENGPQII